MITLNLISPELRKKKQASAFGGDFKIPLEVVVGTGAAFVVLLILAHISLLALNLTKLNQHRKLTEEWEELRPAKENVDQVLAGLRGLQLKEKQIDQVTGSVDIRWAPKFNIISDALPRGVWLRKIALNENMLFIEGSAISRQRKEMINVHAFTTNLKNQNLFLQDLTRLELGSIQRRQIKSVEIADFVITTELGEHEED